MIGPLAVAAVLARQGNYQLAFALLSIPAIVTLLLVLGARLSFPNADRIERKAEAASGRHYPPAFWWYLIGAGLVGFGFADYSLIAYHFSKGQTVPPTWVPIFYALAMGAGALGSLTFGKLFDRIGLFVLVPVTVIVAAYAPLSFFGGFALALIGALLWGIGLGAHESVMQAAVAQMIPQERLGSAYGLFCAAFGVAWFAGSAGWSRRSVGGRRPVANRRRPNRPVHNLLYDPGKILVERNMAMTTAVQAAEQKGGRIGSPLEVLRVFTKLGVSCFGGPIAHIGYFREEFVVRRRWLDEQAAANALALVDALARADNDVTAAVALWEPDQIRLGLHYRGQGKILGDQSQFSHPPTTVA